MKPDAWCLITVRLFGLIVLAWGIPSLLMAFIHAFVAERWTFYSPYNTTLEWQWKQRSVTTHFLLSSLAILLPSLCACMVGAACFLGGRRITSQLRDRHSPHRSTANAKDYSP